MLSDGDLLEDPGRVLEVPEHRWPVDLDDARMGDGFLLLPYREDAESAQAAE